MANEENQRSKEEPVVRLDGSTCSCPHSFNCPICADLQGDLYHVGHTKITLSFWRADFTVFPVLAETPDFSDC